jgi:integrase
MSKRPTTPLVDATLKGLIKAGKPAAKSDGDGLTFTVSSTGYASWILRYGFAGTRRELTIGRYPEISLLEARKIARTKRALIDQSIDVAAQQKAAKRAARHALTVEQLVKDYRKVTLDAYAKSTRKLYGGYLENWVIPKLGSMKMRDVTASDVVAMLQSVSVRGPGAVRSLHAVTRNVFEHAIGQGRLDKNPARDIKRKTIVAIPATRKGIALNDAQLRLFLGKLTDDAAGWAFRLHLITGVRPAEMLEASWNEFDLIEGTWSVPAHRTKMRNDYTISLPPQAISMLRKLKKETEGSQFLFPAAYGELDRPIPYQTYRGRLRRILNELGEGFPAIKAHDLRRTMRSGLTRLGVRFEVAERAINHKLPSLAEIYDRNDFAVERRDAIVKWANHLDSLEVLVVRA